MKNSVNKSIGPFKTLTLEGSVNSPCVVLFHGYGADASDLLPLADIMGLSPDLTWVFPEAPLEVIVAPGFYGRAWFQIDNRRIEKSVLEGEPSDMSSLIPDGLNSVKKNGLMFFNELRKKHSQIILGGFSQGAMLAIELALAAEVKPAGLVIISGTIINQIEWQKNVTSCNGLSFFQSHGKNDVLLGYSFAEKLYDLLSGGGLFGEFVAFNGGHEIPPKVIEKIGYYISNIIRRK